MNPDNCPECDTTMHFEDENGLNRMVCPKCFYVEPEGDEWYWDD